MSISCVVIDAGARYGLHPSWADMRNLAEFHLFEMDEVEAERLARKYAKDKNITVYPIALHKENATLRFKVSAHQALNSLFSTNDDVLQKNEYMIRDFAVQDERTAQARSIDSMFEGKDVHFLKLDIEGAEYNALQGARSVLQRSVLGVRSEVVFSPVYRGAELFGDLHALLAQQGFELLNFDYTGNGNKAGRFTLPGRYGKLVSSDAVWVIGNDRLFAQKGEALLADIVRFAIFLMNNGATDLAIDLLVRAVTRENVAIAPVKGDPLVRYLQKKVLILFKSLLGFPMLAEDDITSTYKIIFDEDFPLMNKFYESEFFQ